MRDVAGHLPGLGDVLRRDFPELGDPVLDVLTLGVVVLGLLRDVELVDAAASHPGGGDPVTPVGGAVVVQELVLEPLGAEPPVHPGVEREPGRDVLSASVGHESRRGQLAHVGVHQRVSGLALLPRGERGGVVAPRAGAAFVPGAAHLAARGALGEEDGVTVLEREELKKIPPDELEDEPVRGLVLHALRLKLANLGDNLPRRHASVREPRRQLGRVISAEHAVARLEVRGDLLALPDVVPNPGERRGLATLEGEDAVGVRTRRRDGALILVREWQVRDRRLEREGFHRVRGHGERALGGGRDRLARFGL